QSNAPAEGFVWLSVPHTTCALILCEADDDMLRDIEHVAEGLFSPFEPFKHRKNNNPNAAAHLFAAVAGTQLVLPVFDGQFGLGTYQRLILVELDGPRDRTIQIAALGPNTAKGG
ncbi:MAG: secondary thiamine-phosphate synthase enzyme YjbQ, partial [Haloechinothrix sp.]